MSGVIVLLFLRQFLFCVFAGFSICSCSCWRLAGVILPWSILLVLFASLFLNMLVYIYLPACRPHGNSHMFAHLFAPSSFGCFQEVVLLPGRVVFVFFGLSHCALFPPALVFVFAVCVCDFLLFAPFALYKCHVVLARRRIRIFYFPVVSSWRPISFCNLGPTHAQ